MSLRCESGYLYVLSNEKMPGVYKVGRTINCPNSRAKEIFSTGTPVPFDVAKSYPVANVVDAERNVHMRLNEYRTHPRREFFEAPIITISAIAGAVCSEINSCYGASFIEVDHSDAGSDREIADSYFMEKYTENELREASIIGADIAHRILGHLFWGDSHNAYYQYLAASGLDKVKFEYKPFNGEDFVSDMIGILASDGRTRHEAANEMLCDMEIDYRWFSGSCVEDEYIQNIINSTLNDATRIGLLMSMIPQGCEDDFMFNFMDNSGEYGWDFGMIEGYVVSAERREIMLLQVDSRTSEGSYIPHKYYVKPSFAIEYATDILLRVSDVDEVGALVNKSGPLIYESFVVEVFN